MGRRSNSGYIGRDFELDSKGIIDLNKRNLTRFLNEDPYYGDETLLYTGPGFEPINLYLLGTSSFGSGSLVSSNLVSGTLAAVTIVPAGGGSGYGTSATMSFSGGGGTGANGYVSTYAGGALSVVERLGYIKDIIITDAGEGYTSAPTMSVSAPITANGVVGVIASISASITNGQLTGYTINNSGSNYRAGANFPTITFTGGGAIRSAAAVPVLEFGRNYTSNPTVTITGTGTGAVVSASIVGVLAPTASITTAGGGYTSPPTVVIPSISDSNVIETATLSGNSLSVVSFTTGRSTVHDILEVNIGGELNYPTLNNNEIYGTYAVYNNNSNWLSFNITTNGGGGYNVDWGDGTSNNYNSNVASSHQYTTLSFNALSSSLYNGAKLAQVKITLSGSATSLATVNFTTRPTPTTGSFSTTAHTNQWLSIAMAGSNINSLTVGSTSANTLGCNKLQKFYFSGSNQITSFGSMFIGCSNLREVTDLFMGSATSATFSNMFSGCNSLTTIPAININNVASANVSQMFINCFSLPSVTFISASTATNLTSTFQSCRNLRTINGDLFSSNNTNLTSTFSSCFLLSKLPPINVSNVTTLSGTFNSCYSLSSIKFIGNTRLVTTFGQTFTNCYSLNDLPKEFDLTSCTSLSNTFNGCNSLREAPRFTNTKLVNTVSAMFASCRSLKKIHLFDTSAVTSFSLAFQACSSLTSIPRFNLRNTTDVSSMFNGCILLKRIPLFNTANVTNFATMFSGCTNLITIPSLNTSKGTSFSSMFNGCSSLKSIPYIDTGNSTTFLTMFQDCTSLTDIPTFNTSNATTVASMFTNCPCLRKVPNFNLPNATTTSGMFSSCTSLEEGPILYNAIKVTDMSTMFASCTNLTRTQRVTGGVNASLNNITNMFSGCTNLIEVGAIPISVQNITTTTAFSNNFSLKRMQAFSGIVSSFSVANCSLDSVALNEIYTNLGTNAATITVTGNWGTANDNPAIATAKGWTVTG